MTAELSRLNFRDLGGLPAGRGKRLRAGLIYRSEGPASFFDAHKAELGALGFRSVCDLRSAVEREHAPHDWCGTHCRLIELDLNADLRAQGADLWDTLREDGSGDNARRAIVDNHRHMPAALLPHWRALAGALLDGDVPMMIHCTAGKDRTGVAVAILLALLGVDQAAILDDYLRSDIFAENMKLAGSIEQAFDKSFGFVPSAPAIAMLIGVDAQFVTEALREIDARWGSMEAYFMAANVDARAQARLRTLLLEDDR